MVQTELMCNKYILDTIFILGYITSTNHVRNEDVLLRVNKQRNVLHEIRKRKANWIGHILLRNRLPKER